MLTNLYQRLAPRHRRQLVQGLLGLWLLYALPLAAMAASPAAPPSASAAIAHPTSTTQQPGKTNALNRWKKMRFERVLGSDIQESFQGFGGSIRDIIQDNEGFMWFAGEYGLVRYDSKVLNFYHADSEKPRSLSTNNMSCLMLDKTGVLWIATNNGVNRYNSATDDFDRYQMGSAVNWSLTSNLVNGLAVDAANRLYVGTQDGLVVVEADRVTARLFRHDPQDPHSISSNKIRRLLVDGERLWIGTSTGGLNLFDTKTQRFTHWRHDPEKPDSLPQDDVTTLLADRQGRFWAGTHGGGLSRLNPDGQTFTRYVRGDDPHSLPSNAVRDLLEDKRGNIWIATDHGGLSLFDEANNHFINQRHSPFDLSTLSSNQVRSIFEDKVGNLWVGTFPYGVNLYDTRSSLFEVIQNKADDPTSLQHNGILSILESKDGTFWVGTEGGLASLDPVTRKVERFIANPKDPNALRFNAVTSLVEDPSGDLWVATWSGGLHRFNRRTKTFKNYYPDPEKPGSLPSAYAWQLTIDPKGDLWIAFVERGGLARYNPSTDSFESYKHTATTANANASGMDEIWSLTAAKKGGLWLGTLNGLNHFDTTHKTFKAYTYDPTNPNGLNSKHVLSVLELDNGELWVGTEGGINILNQKTDQWRWITTHQGLPSNAVAAMQIDRDGYIWALTLNGVARINSKKTEDIKTFYRSDGLAGNSYNRNALLYDSQQMLWIGSTNGITRFDPANLNSTLPAPRVALTTLRVANQLQIPGAKNSKLQKVVSHTNTLQLSYEDRMFTLDFAALSYNASKRNRYAYKLEGFDKDWNLVGPEQNATYTNLDPGKYVFHVKAANADGLWNENSTRLNIQVSTPPWRTGPAYALYLAVAIALLYWLHKTVSLHNKSNIYRALSTTDALTGILNRHGIDQVAAGLFLNEQTKNGLCVMLTDIDHFKRINDLRGHDAGDRVLAEMAAVINAATRKSDHFARWGGEEFLLICPGTSLEDAERLANKIRQAAEGYTFEQHLEPLTVTISLGLAACRPDDDFASLLKRADNALYRAKHSGRNRVEVET
jgi:diguanylate cyclase (GGDEF)-like protein